MLWVDLRPAAEICFGRIQRKADEKSKDQRNKDSGVPSCVNDLKAGCLRGDLTCAACH